MTSKNNEMSVCNATNNFIQNDESAAETLADTFIDKHNLADKNKENTEIANDKKADNPIKNDMSVTEATPESCLDKHDIVGTKEQNTASDDATDNSIEKNTTRKLIVNAVKDNESDKMNFTTSVMNQDTALSVQLNPANTEDTNNKISENCVVSNEAVEEIPLVELSNTSKTCLANEEQVLRCTDTAMLCLQNTENVSNNTIVDAAVNMESDKIEPLENMIEVAKEKSDTSLENVELNVETTHDCSREVKESVDNKAENCVQSGETEGQSGTVESPGNNEKVSTIVTADKERQEQVNTISENDSARGTTEISESNLDLRNEQEEDAQSGSVGEYGEDELAAACTSYSDLYLPDNSSATYYQAIDMDEENMAEEEDKNPSFIIIVSFLILFYILNTYKVFFIFV